MLDKKYLEATYPFNEPELRKIDFNDFTDNLTLSNVSQRLYALSNILQSVNSMLVFGNAFNADTLDYKFLEKTKDTAEATFLVLCNFRNKANEEPSSKKIITFKTFVEKGRRKNGLGKSN